MFRRIFWINLGLAAIVFLLALNVYKIWRSVIKKEWKEPAIVSAGSISENEATFGDEQSYKPALYTYDVIADKNLFRPQRTEWLPDLPEKEESEKEKKPLPTQRNQAAMKEPVLYGIMIRRDSKSALMKGSIREEAKERFREVRLGSGQVRKVPLPSRPGRIVPDKVRTYHVGDEINDSLVVDILQDRVILSKNGEEYELLLREPSRLAAKNAPGPDKESINKNLQGLQTVPPQPGQFPNFPRLPAYPPPGFPVYPPPQGQRQAGAPGFGYPVIPPQGGRIPKAPPRPPFQQIPGQGSAPPVYPNLAGPGSPYFRPLPGMN